MNVLSPELKEMKDAVTAELIAFLQRFQNDEEHGKPRYTNPFMAESRCTNWGIRYTDGTNTDNLLYIVYDHARNEWGLSNVLNYIKVQRQSKEDAIELFKFIIHAIPRVNRYQREHKDSIVATDPQIPAELRPLMLRRAA